MKAMTGDLCWVASLLLQLRIVLTLSSYSSQFVFFPHKSFGSRSEKSPKCISAGIWWKKKGTVRSDRGSHGSLFFSIERFLKLKEPQKWTVRGFSGWTVRSGPGVKTMMWPLRVAPLEPSNEINFLSIFLPLKTKLITKKSHKIQGNKLMKL